MKMPEQVRAKIDADIERYREIDESVAELEDIIKGLHNEQHTIKTRLFENRPREFGRRLLEYMQKRGDEDADYSNWNGFLMALVEDWVSGPEEYLQERYRNSTGEERAMLTGELDPYA